MNLSDKIKVMQAAERGEQIERQLLSPPILIKDGYGPKADDSWNLKPDHDKFDFNTYSYKIKPKEPEQPKTIAYGLTAEQLIGAVLKHKKYEDDFSLVTEGNHHWGNYDLYRAPYAPIEVQRELAEWWNHEL